MEAEERQALSIDSQIKEMMAIAERENLEVICTKFESHSAKNSGQREVFNELIYDLKAHKYNAILTWNTDRLSRNAGDLGQIVDLMDRGDLVTIRTFGQIFTCNPNDKFLLMILGSQAKLENDNKGINVQRGMRARVEMGLWPSVAPTGYVNSKIKGEECVKYIDPNLAPIVREMFEKTAYDGYTNRQIYFWLKEKGIRTRTGKFMNMGSIHEILNRTFYYGEFEYPKRSGKWYKGSHEPIISKELFEQTQKVLKLHSRVRSYKRRGTEPFTFARFMCCGLCGSGIIADEHFKRPKNGKVHRYVYYHCSNGTTRTCKGCYINEEELIEQFTKLIGTVDVEFIGKKDETNVLIDKYYGYKSYLSKTPIPERTQERKDSDLRKYTQILFRDGTPEDRLNIIKSLRKKVALKDKVIYFDPSLEELKRVNELK
jgi:DNA invertase Pin-like site-specific DNA recombinase